MSIKVQHFTKTYGAQTAVNDISFSINEGEIVGFLGPNGAGKSTTMKTITGYLAVQKGIVEVCGINVAENAKLSKQKIGYLPEANPLYVDMYVREYIQFIANLHGLKNIKSKTENIIETIGIGTEAHKKISQLSKGYKQRVGLAAALIHEPEVLILDEPTSGLDPNQIIEIRNVIKTLSANKTVLFSSHILQEVEAICDRVIIIHKGNIVANDTIQQLQKTDNKQQIITVTFIENVDLKKLQSLPHVLEITQTNNTYTIKTNSADALRKVIVQFSIEHNLNISSLQNQQNSLEAVFRELTTG